MGDKTGIAWTDATWNPVTGCSKVSAGCKHCYAERVFPRAYHGQTVDRTCTMCGGDGGDVDDSTEACDECRGSGTERRARRFTDVVCHPERLDQPLRWRRPRRVFVNSMSDLFHPDVPVEFIIQVFAVMGAAQQHTFQVLTKRPERMREILGGGGEVAVALNLCLEIVEGTLRDIAQPVVLPNVWLGVSAEDQATFAERVPILMDTPAAVRFVSAEPLLGPIDMSATCAYNDVGDGAPVWRGPDWIIVGGESGPKARPMDLAWARGIRDQCQEAGVHLFIKQLGANAYEETPLPLVTARWHTKHRAGAAMDEWPVDLQVQEWPA